MVLAAHESLTLAGLLAWPVTGERHRGGLGTGVVQAHTQHGAGGVAGDGVAGQEGREGAHLDHDRQIGEEADVGNRIMSPVADALHPALPLPRAQGEAAHLAMHLERKDRGAEDTWWDEG